MYLESSQHTFWFALELDLGLLDHPLPLLDPRPSRLLGSAPPKAFALVVCSLERLAELLDLDGLEFLETGIESRAEVAMQGGGERGSLSSDGRVGVGEDLGEGLEDEVGANGAGSIGTAAS